MRPTKHRKWAQAQGRYLAPQLQLKETVRQEAIHELIRVEEVHFHNLEVLDMKFSRQMLSGNLLTPDEVKLIFPSLDQLMNIHGSLLKALWELQQNGPVINGLGDTLIPFFDGEAGDRLIQEAVTFCSNHNTAMKLIEAKKKTSKAFKRFLKEAERRHPRSKIPLIRLYNSEEQIVNRYPDLLLDILASTQDGSQDAQVLERCLERCHRLKVQVKIAMEKMEADKFLADVQQHLDTSALKKAKDLTAREFADMDLSKRRLLYDGPLKWKISKGKVVDVHALVLDDTMVLLKKRNRKYILKCRKHCGRQAETILSPVIKMERIIAQPVATDMKSFFVVDYSSSPRVYEFSAVSENKRNSWVQALEEAGAMYNTRSNSPSSHTTMNVEDPAESTTTQPAVWIIWETSL